MPGVRVRVTDRCVGCGTCAQDICFGEAIQIHAGEAIIDEACRASGRCVSVCPNDANQLQIDDGDYLEKTLERLSSALDLTWSSIYSFRSYSQAAMPFSALSLF